MRRILYDYPMLLGIIKLLIYKFFYGPDLELSGIPHVSKRACIRIRKGGKVFMGKRSRLSDGDYLWVTEGGLFALGDNSSLGVNCIVSCRERITIGKNVMIGPFVTFYDNDHVYVTEGIMAEAGYQTAPISISDNVWIGNQVKILKGVTIGEGSVIAAGTIVNKDVPPHTLYYNKKEDLAKKI